MYYLYLGNTYFNCFLPLKSCKKICKIGKEQDCPQNCAVQNQYGAEETVVQAYNTPQGHSCYRNSEQEAKVKGLLHILLVLSELRLLKIHLTNGM